MKLENAMVVFWKDWKEIRRNYQVLAPILFVPMIFTTVLPLMLVVVPSAVGVPGTTIQFLGPMFENLPEEIKAAVEGMVVEQSMIYIFALYFFAPFFLIIPIMASSVIASDSFAGEKDRKTLEALLATPLTDGELLLGKVLVAFIPSMLVTVASFALYCVVVDLAYVLRFGGEALLPNALWLMLIFGVTPAVALAGIGLTVIISLRVKGYREAQQMSAVLIVPVLALVFAQVGGAIFFGQTMILLMAAAFAFVDAVVLALGIKRFRREDLLTKCC
ncbi:MAG: ABC transporter permease subunit [Candidatus Verstraetearchaeota archaeon]|nr:ABC transporter permease subunit [Candidatus Verstraetearchaeota archaeon]